MKQPTLATMTGFVRYTKKTRRTQFLEEMEQVVPWGKLCALIEPHYPKAGNGRPPVGGAANKHGLRVYHCPATRCYGRTTNGEYLTQSEAQNKGHRPPGGRPPIVRTTRRPSVLTRRAS
jgi:hypothetical protein